MKLKMLQDLITVMESDGPTQIGTYTMPGDQIPDTTGLRGMIIGIEVTGAYSGTTRPTLYFESSDDLGRQDWHVVWSSGAQAAASAILTLSSALEPGEPYRLGRYLRWRVVFPTPGSDPSLITFRIGATVN